MSKPFGFHGVGVEAEKAEAMRRYNNRIIFRNVLRAAAVASLTYLWFPAVAISLQAAGVWFYRTGSVIATNRAVVFVFVNILGALIFILSSDRGDESKTSASTEPDLYDQFSYFSAVNVTASSDEKVRGEYTNVERCTSVVSAEPDQYVRYTSSSSSAGTGAASDEKVEDGESKKQIVAAFFAEVEEAAPEDDGESVTTDLKGVYRRTKSENKKGIMRPAKEYRRTESAIERLSSEEFRLKVETFILEKRRKLIQENDVVRQQGLVAAVSGYGTC